MLIRAKILENVRNGKCGQQGVSHQIGTKPNPKPWRLNLHNWRPQL
jgi:hypothetical protein